MEALLLDQVATRAYRPEVETRALEEIEREVTTTEAELHAWATDVDILSLGRDTYVAGLKAREQRMEDAQARRRALLANAATALPSRTELAVLWPTLTTGEKRRLLSSVIDAVVVGRTDAARWGSGSSSFSTVRPPSTCPDAASGSPFGRSTSTHQRVRGWRSRRMAMTALSRERSAAGVRPPDGDTTGRAWGRE